MKKLFNLIERGMRGFMAVCITSAVWIGGAAVPYLLTELGTGWSIALGALFIVAFVAGVMQDDD